MTTALFERSIWAIIASESSSDWKLKNIFNFQSLDDSLAIIAQIERSKSAVVIGGSYIAYELTEAFRMRGLHTTWMMRGPWFLRRLLDEAGGMLVDRIAQHHAVEVVHGCEIAAWERQAATLPFTH